MPDLAHHDIAEHDRLACTLDTQFPPLGAGSQGLERHRPRSILSGRALADVLGELDGHVFVFVRPAPNLDRSIALKHHVVREDARQANLGPRIWCNGSQQDQQQGKSHGSIHGNDHSNIRGGVIVDYHDAAD